MFNFISKNTKEISLKLLIHACLLFIFRFNINLSKARVHKQQCHVLSFRNYLCEKSSFSFVLGPYKLLERIFLLFFYFIIL